MKMIKGVSFVLILAVMGCQSPTREAIENYRMSTDQIAIGDSKEKVLSILAPTQETLSASQLKTPEVYRNEQGDLIEIYFFRSSIQDDGILTDDEFTPYVFKNGELIAIGWAYLGGPKTQAQPDQDVYIRGGWGWGWHYYH